MQETTNAESVENLPEPTGSVPNTSKPTGPETEGGGEPTKWEYEFSTCHDGRVMFIGMWDTSDVSACERLMHRPLKPEDITYSPETGNGFVVDCYDNKYTFKKSPIFRTVEWPEFEDMRQPTRKVPDVMDILASL
jgi:hypothetical protein